MMIAVMPGQLLQLNQAGTLRIHAVTTEIRLGHAPGIPTAIESGMPDLRYAGWLACFAPEATPDKIVDVLSAVPATGTPAPM
jgi:tripartite-type tricarboxylate transporter receptor subunit TctC